MIHSFCEIQRQKEAILFVLSLRTPHPHLYMYIKKTLVFIINIIWFDFNGGGGGATHPSPPPNVPPPLFNTFLMQIFITIFEFLHGSTFPTHGQYTSRLHTLLMHTFIHIANYKFSALVHLHTRVPRKRCVNQK